MWWHVFVLLLLAPFPGHAAKAVRQFSLEVEHSLDRGRSWQPKGKVTVKVGGGVSEIKFQPAFAAWQPDQLAALVELSTSGGQYQVRVPAGVPSAEEGKGDAPPSPAAQHVRIAVAPCVIFESNFKEQYNFFFATSGSAITGVVGLQNVGMKLKAEGPHFCSLLAGDEPATLTVDNLPVPRKHTAAFGLVAPLRPPAVPEDVYVGVRTPDGPGGPAPPPEERSFLQKYWFMIVIAGVSMFITGGVSEETRRQQEERGNAPPAAAAKPAAGQKKSN
eukprot:TRINITY_DN4591_c0_g1_i1.p1 TRINITY_DN4591_c0_g1~~TRINITY_DN4591_c0_g1_i1.p1  ORF type:complete len:283 (+),score=102.78 TRINITY_DN4591_c0_g1_i1:25-849(+)